MKHTISVLVNNRPGVLARAAGLFARRGYNIDSLTVGETQDPRVSRMTIVVRGDDRILEQVIKQLNKLIDVIDVIDFKKSAYVGRELVLIKVRCNTVNRTEVLEIVNIFRAKPVDIGHETMIIQITGSDEKVDAFIRLMEPFGIVELARTGRVAMIREVREKTNEMTESME